MNKAQKINLTMEKLKEEREELLKQVREKENLLKEQMEEYRKLYPDFFVSRTNLDFILYDKFPPFKQIEAYYYKNAQYHILNHPIYEYGQFDIRELAEIIKLLYSYQRQKNIK